MKFFRLLEGRVVTFAFFGEHMQHYRMVTAFCIFEGLNHQRQIMTVQRANVANAQLLKNYATRGAAAAVLRAGRLMFE